ncbi:HAMP domain-containing sensor histidine kinase [Angustibacter peucedani]
MSAGEDDRRALRRAARSVAVRTTGLVALVVLVVSGVALLVDVRQRAGQARDVAHSAWARADDVDDPPPSTWLTVVGPDGARTTTPGAPASVARLDPATLPDGPGQLEQGERQLVLWAGDRPRLGRVVAVYDRSADLAELGRLVVSLGVASLVGIACAAAVGAFVGRRAVRPLGDALALQRRFVADASHELRAPLTVLSTRAQLLRRSIASDRTADGEQLAQADRVVDDARRLGDVVQDLLESAVLEHHGPDGGRAEPVDLAQLVREVVDHLQPLAAEAQVHVRAAPDPAEITVAGARTALRRAVGALVDNAVAHAGGGSVVVDVRADGPSHVRVLVTDDGDGLDVEQARHLVQRFARGRRADASSGYGLGLALVTEVARAHGGRLDVDGRPAEGATFALVLPRDDGGPAPRNLP